MESIVSHPSGYAHFAVETYVELHHYPLGVEAAVKVLHTKLFGETLGNKQVASVMLSWRFMVFPAWALVSSTF